MRRKGALFLATLVLFVHLAWPVASQAQTGAFPPAANGQQLHGVIQRAEKLETEHRWGEAVTLYEEALREHPGDRMLSSRHTLAKIHYDIARRYSDSSYVRVLSTLPARDAIALYSEVLLKIQSHYVTEPSWPALVERGTAALEVAVGQEAFAQRNIPVDARQRAAALPGYLRSTLRSRTISNRQEAIEAVTAAGQLARRYSGISPTAVVLEYTCGAIAALDEYSSYLTVDQLNDVYSQIEGNFVGLGIELKSNDSALQIMKVITGSPAQRGGIKAGDRIVAVDGRSTARLTTDQAADLLQGEEGSMVEVTLESPNRESRRVVLRREHVEVPSVDEVHIADAAYGIGYLKLTCFQKTTSRDLDTALWKLHREGMKSLVMDLRGNPGGLLTSSVEVADKFVTDGVIVSTRGRNSLEDYSYTAHRAGTWSVPLVVLIDGDSASASEIFAGAIHDHHRGVVVGQRSYGKGSVQGIFPLAIAGSGVRLTTAKFYSPSGQPISHVGVEPDLIVQKVARPTELGIAPAGEDPVIAAALQAARRQTAQR